VIIGFTAGLYEVLAIYIPWLDFLMPMARLLADEGDRFAVLCLGILLVLLTTWLRRRVARQEQEHP
jgi:hypothetical protein